MGNKLVRASVVAEQLDMSEHRVYAAAREGLIPSVRIGRQIRFSPAAIEEFIRNGGKALPGGWRKKA